MKAQTATAQKTASPDLNAYLAPGEKVLWSGKPELKLFVLRTWPLSIFGAVLLVAIIAFETTILTTEAPDFLALWGVPFALAGLYMVVGHFLVTYREWGHIEYMLTESRLLIRHGILSPAVAIYSLLGLPHTLIKMQSQDVGNIMFEPREGQGYGPWPGYQTMWPYTPGYILGLMYIRNPQHVQQAIEKARVRE